MYEIGEVDQHDKVMRNPATVGESITDGIREGNDTMRILYRGALMGLMMEKMRALMHETMTIFVKNAIPPLRVYLMENATHIKSMKSAIRFAEQWERAQGKLGIARVGEINLKATPEEEKERQDQKRKDN